MFDIRFTDDAERHLDDLPARDRKIVLTAIEDQLQHQPTTQTRNRKRLRKNPLATWELRVQKYRVLYNADEETVTVVVIAIAEKVGNRFIIDGEEHPL